MLDSGKSTTDTHTRLHVTPLDPQLINVVLSASVLPKAQNISYHSLETFPERRYGFLELPHAEADQLKKKLNGSTLRGVKMSVEKARQETWMEAPDDGQLEEKKKKKRKRSREEKEASKKRKKDSNVVDGMLLNDRKVKRGWTETPAETRSKKQEKAALKSKKDKTNKDVQKSRQRTKSKHTDGAECLLKVKLPANAMPNLSPEEVETVKRRSKKGRDRNMTVHEFDHTAPFPSFLKAETVKGGHAAVEFVEGKGWVDSQGNVVEAVKGTGPRKESRPTKEKLQKRKKAQTPSDSETSSSGSDTSDDEAESEETPQVPPPKVEPDDSSTSSSDDGSSSDSETEEPPAPPTVSHQTPVKARPQSSTSNMSLTIDIPPPPDLSNPSTREVHPLEALYKRPADTDQTLHPRGGATSFSFFDSADHDDAGSDAEPPQQRSGPSQIAMPMTPFTEQDFQWRNVRSAAPTPDTAHPSRINNIWAGSTSGLPQSQTSTVPEDEEIPDAAVMTTPSVKRSKAAATTAQDPLDEDTTAAATSTAVQPRKTEFQSWFWENRRELNRRWMSRRKTAAKEKRHRENKARAARMV